MFKEILCVKKSTNLVGLFGELGRVPLNVIRKIHIFRYWHKILQSNENSLIKHIYTMLESDANNGNSYNNQNWAYQIKSKLETTGARRLDRFFILSLSFFLHFHVFCEPS